jgi:hypothetical protein
MSAGVGICDWCGTVDHHLVAGECASCRKARHPLHANRTHTDFGIDVEEMPVERVRLAPPPRREVRR